MPPKLLRLAVLAILFATAMAGVRAKTYKPNAAAHAVYEKIFAEYDALHDAFGRGANDVMKRLKALKGVE